MASPEKQPATKPAVADESAEQFQAGRLALFGVVMVLLIIGAVIVSKML